MYVDFDKCNLDMAKKKIFISFDYTNDHRYKDLLVAWSYNSNFDFSFNNYTSNEINSSNISAIKAALTNKINQADYTLIIVGKECNKRHKDYREIGYKNWQIFELEKSKLAHNKIIAVKLDVYNETPEELYGIGAVWALSFTFNSIKRAIDSI